MNAVGSIRRLRGNAALYSLLAMLAMLVTVYEVQYLHYVSSLLLSPATVARAPFDYSPDKGITALRPEAVRAGIVEGDTLLGVNGEPFSGQAVLQKNLARSKPNQPMSLLLRQTSHGQTAQATGPTISAVLLLAPVRSEALSPGLMLRAMVELGLIPLLCLCLGFSLVAIRVRDHRAWIVLVLMISLSQQYRIAGWKGSPSLPLLLYQAVAPLVIGIALFLFAITFPVRAQWDRRRPWLKWLVLAPLLCAVLTTAFSHVAQDRFIGVLPPVFPLLDFVENAGTVLNLCCLAVFIWEAVRRIRSSGTPSDSCSRATV